MGIRSILSKPLANVVAGQTRKWSADPEGTQQRTLEYLLRRARHTAFGKAHALDQIRGYDAFPSHVPIVDYEQLRPWIERVMHGEQDVLWPGTPLYMAKTSGTTSGVKYIPISKASISNHINGARNALLAYIHETGRASFIDGKLIFLSGSPVLHEKDGIRTGRLSGIVNHHVPSYLRSNQLPAYETNCIEDWETKLDRIIDETVGQDLRLISGIPPWVQMYFDRIVARTGKKVKDVFPAFSVLVYGGVNFAPYRDKLFHSIGGPVDTIETYPASEGFIAYQDTRREEGLLLLLNSGIFYEFVPLDEYFTDHPRRIPIDEVELNRNYALIINNNAGLWGYAIGDTVKFVSKKPYRIVVTGRVKHFLSAFGEHVIGEEVEKAMSATLRQFPETEIVEFTVAPQVTPAEGLPYHEWLVEFARPPHDPDGFARQLDLELRRLNIYYDDLITGSILRPLVLTTLRPHGFIDYMKAMGKLGGQNKVPRLSNDRKLAEGLATYVTVREEARP